MLMNIKLSFFCLLCFAVNNSCAQQQDKDSLPDYMKKYKMYRIPGISDSAINLQHWDSTKLWKKAHDSIMRQRSINIPRNHVAYIKRK